MKDKALGLLVFVLAIIAIVLGFVIVFSPAKDNGKVNNTEAPSVSDNTELPDETAEPTLAPSPTPAGRLSGLVVCLDPGHQAQQMKDKEPLAPWDKTTLKQKVSSGTSGKFTHRDEYVVVLEIGFKIKELLEAEGATVVMTRESADVMLSNIDRAEIGNNCNADVVLRIHCNGSDNASVEGIEMWVPGNGDGSSEYKALSSYCKKLAEELLVYIVGTTGAKKRNVNTSDSYTGLNWSEVPSIIMELGFMSNEKEDKLLSDPEYQQKIANGIRDWLVHSEVLKR